MVDILTVWVEEDRKSIGALDISCNNIGLDGSFFISKAYAPFCLFGAVPLLILLPELISRMAEQAGCQLLCHLARYLCQRDRGRRSNCTRASTQLEFESQAS